MKLSNQQIDALASKIRKEITTPAYKFNEEVRKTEEYKTFTETDKDCIIIKQLQEKYGLESYYTNTSIDRIKNDYFKNSFKRIPEVSLGEIRDEIVLETIEATNLDELITKITAKFTEISE